MKHETKPIVEANPAPVARTSAGLRDAIFDELDFIRNGTSNPTRANAVAKLAAGVVETVRMEIEVQKHQQSKLNQTKQVEVAEGLGTPLPLGA